MSDNSYYCTGHYFNLYKTAYQFNSITITVYKYYCVYAH